MSSLVLRRASASRLSGEWNDDDFLLMASSSAIMKAAAAAPLASVEA
jgi:hypothetical protein